MELQVISNHLLLARPPPCTSPPPHKVLGGGGGGNGQPTRDKNSLWKMQFSDYDKTVYIYNYFVLSAVFSIRLFAPMFTQMLKTSI